MRAAPFASMAPVLSMAFFATRAAADGNDEIEEVRDDLDSRGARSTVQARTQALGRSRGACTEDRRRTARSCRGEAGAGRGQELRGAMRPVFGGAFGPSSFLFRRAKRSARRRSALARGARMPRTLTAAASYKLNRWFRWLATAIIH